MKLLPLALSAALAVTASAAPKPRTVTLNVKDGDARVILESMQKQCGIKNLIIDPEVKASGTFFFRDLPCHQAFPVVLKTMGLAGKVYANSIVTVEPR